MRRWVLCLLALAALVGGCGFRPGAERAVARLLDALQDGRLSRAEDCVADGALSFGGRSRSAKAFYKAVFATLSYDVTETEERDDSAAVTLTVTAVNMDVLVAAETSRLLDSALSGEKLDGEDFYKALTEIIKAGGAEYVTALVTAHVAKTDKGWQVDLAASPAFADAITGGVGELIL